MQQEQHKHMMMSWEDCMEIATAFPISYSEKIQFSTEKGGSNIATNLARKKTIIMKLLGIHSVKELMEG